MNNKQAAQGAGASKQVDELATISLEALFQRLGTTKAGLSEEEAKKRLDHTRGRRKGWRFLKTASGVSAVHPFESGSTESRMSNFPGPFSLNTDLFFL